MNKNYPATKSSYITPISENYYIVFSVNNKNYAINIKHVIEVINIPIIEIPETLPEGIAGLFNYKNNITKVIDICPLLGFKTSPFNINNQLIVININGDFFAIHTENILNIEYIDNDLLQEVPYLMDDSILQYLYKTENSTINIINTNVLINVISKNRTKQTKINYLDLFPKDSKSLEILQIREQQNKIRTEEYAFNFNLNEQNKYVLFTLGSHNYYIDLKYVKEFSSAKRLTITKLPYTQEYIKGIVNIQGEFILVVDLELFINSKHSSDNNTKGKLIIVEGKNFDIAFFVDDIKYIESLNNIHPSSYNNNISKYIYAEFIENDKLYGIINTEKVINDERLYINID